MGATMAPASPDIWNKPITWPPLPSRTSPTIDDGVVDKNAPPTPTMMLAAINIHG